MTRNQRMTAVSYFSTFADLTVGSAFGGFRIDNIMSPTVNFIFQTYNYIHSYSTVG